MDIMELVSLAFQIWLETIYRMDWSIIIIMDKM